MLPLSFRSASARFWILSFLFFLSALHRFRLTVAFPTPRLSLSLLPDLPRSSQLVSRLSSPVLLIQLSCLFPFALPCFAPTAVPQVLRYPPLSTASFPDSSLRPFALRFPFSPRFRFPSTFRLPFPFCFHPASFPQLSFRFAPVRLGLRYLVSASSFPCFKLPPHSGFHSAVPLSASFPWLPSFRPTLPTFVSSGHPFRLPTSSHLSAAFHGSFSSFAPLPPSPFGFFGPFRSGFGTQFRCSSFHRSRFRLTAATSFRLPTFSGLGLPLRFFLPLRFLRFRLSSTSLRSFPSFAPLPPP